MKPRVRFAPSPTGSLHIGGVRTALYNYLFAKKHGGTFILRIEDTDRGRYVEGAEEYIVESLKWLGISPDEGFGTSVGDCGPYRQSERKDIYGEYAKRLIDNGYAYYAFDTDEDLKKMRADLSATGERAPTYNSNTRMNMKNSLTLSADEVKERLNSGDPYVVRFRPPTDSSIMFNDMVRGVVEFKTNEMDDKVLLKSDGMPTYHLANVVDDYLMKITHVIRGEEWLPSTPLHLYLYKGIMEFGDEEPRFAHLPLIMKPKGNGKLNKRDGAKFGFPVIPLDWKDPETREEFPGFREAGYFSNALINMLALMGWNPGNSNNEEFFTLEELVDIFSLEKVVKNGARFTIDKLNWFNSSYLNSSDNEYLGLLLFPKLKEMGIQRDVDYIAKVCGLLKSRATFLDDILSIGMYFFVRPEKYDEALIKKWWKQDSKEHMEAVLDYLDAVEDCSSENFNYACNKAMGQFDLDGKKAMGTLRLVLTNFKLGPTTPEIAELLGKEETTNRIKVALSTIT